MSVESRRPRRPAVPVTLYALVTLLAVDRIVLRKGQCALTTKDAGWMHVAIALAWLVGLVWLITHRHKALGSLCLVLLVSLGVAYATSSLQLVRMLRISDSLSEMPLSACVLRITTDPTQKESGYRCKATITTTTGMESVVWLTLPQHYERGSVVRGVGRYEENGEDEWGISARMQGICGSVRLVRIIDVEGPRGLSDLATTIRAALCRRIQPESSESRALLASCVCACRDGLTTFGLDELFSRCGVAHLVAVSGGHLSVLMVLLSILMRRIRLRPRVRLVATLTVCGVFVFCCGLPISAIRAWAMVACSHVGALRGRRSHALSSVSVVGLVMVAFDPTLSGQLSFLLSVTSVCGLCLLSAYCTYILRTLTDVGDTHFWVPRRMRRWLSKAHVGACESLGASLAATLVTMPLTAQTFGEVSLVGPLANLLVSLPFSAFMGFGLVASLLADVPLLGPLLLLGCDAIAQVILLALHLCAGIPGAVVPLSQSPEMLLLALVVGVVVLLVVWPAVSRRTLLSAAFALCVVMALQFMRWRFFAPARLCVLDVGQGDAILIQDGSHALLVDTGPDDVLVEALARCHVYHLDAVLITHQHADHYASLDDLVGIVDCSSVIVGQGAVSHLVPELARAASELTTVPVQELAYGDVLRVGDFALRMVWPIEPTDGSENADSVELVLTYQHGSKTLSALLTGDAERDETGAVIAREDVGDIDVLKVGHHGSEVSITTDEAAVLNPEVSVASAGKGNSYGHPSQVCKDVLQQVGSRFLCTMDVGDVDIRPGENGPVVLRRSSLRDLLGST